MSTMEFQVWKSDWGLASVDLDCLKVLAYGKFIGLPINIVESCNPFFSPTGTLPVFRDGKKVFTKFDEIVEYLKSQNYNVDNFLDTQKLAEIFAFSQYLKEKLYPAIQFIWWIDEKNYTEFSRPWYAKAIPFPLNFYYPGRYKRNAESIIDVLYGDNYNQQLVETMLYSEAEKCLTALSERLSDKEFFFGVRPSSLDAIVFAYLAPLLKAPLKNVRLQNHLRGCSNLSRLVTRICQRYFPGVTNEYTTRTKDERNNKKSSIGTQNSGTIGNFPNKTRNKVLAAIFAIIAMTGYAVANGLLQINFRDEFDNIREYNQMYDGEEEDSS